MNASGRRDDVKRRIVGRPDSAHARGELLEIVMSPSGLPGPLKTTIVCNCAGAQIGMVAPPARWVTPGEVPSGTSTVIAITAPNQIAVARRGGRTDAIDDVTFAPLTAPT